MTRLDSSNRAAQTPVEPDLAAALDALARWPDVDSAHGLRLCRGDAAKYVALLGRLVAMLEARVAPLDRLRHHGDRSELRRLAHQIRGVSSNVGAVKVAAAAGPLDSRQLDDLDHEVVAGHVTRLCEAIEALGRGLPAAVRGRMASSDDEASPGKVG